MSELMHVVDRVTIKQKEEFGVNLKRLVVDTDEDDDGLFTPIADEDAPKRRGRPPKKQKDESFLPAVQVERNPINSEMSYESTYDDNTTVLKATVGQIDFINNRILQDLETVRALRDKRKWEYIGGLAGTSTSLIGNKISAIREMNSIITKCHDLEFKRAKELKFGIDDGDDDKKMMDLYNAYVNTPVGAVGTIPFSTMSPADMMTVSNGIPVNENAQRMGEDQGYASYLRNCSPEQNAMYMESNPYIETVLIYDQSTQERHFEVINTQTGQQVPNMPIPSDVELAGTVVDVARGIARNAQLRKNYTLKLIGERAMDEY